MRIDLYHLQLNRLHTMWHEAANKGDTEAAENLEKRINIFEKILKRFEEQNYEC